MRNQTQKWTGDKHFTSSTSKKTSTETLIEEVWPLVLEKIRFELREKSHSVPFLAESIQKASNGKNRHRKHCF